MPSGKQKPYGPIWIEAKILTIMKLNLVCASTMQDGVMCQWHEALQTAGIEPARIRIIGEKKSETKKRVGKRKDSIKKGEFVLLTRYHLQSEMKRMFEYNSVELKANKNKKESFFKSVPTSLIKKLKNQYNAAKGNERNQYSRENEPRQDCVTRLIREVEMEAQFETVIIDESHFLRNSELSSSLLVYLSYSKSSKHSFSSSFFQNSTCILGYWCGTFGSSVKENWYVVYVLLLCLSGATVHIHQ